jgi:hypothetical protein
MEESKVTWGENQPPINKAGTCLSLVLAQGKPPYIEAVDCTNKISYICEVSFFLVAQKRYIKFYQAEDTKGQPYALAKDEMCRNTFNVSVRKLDSMQEISITELKCLPIF